jgi:hypothetical protein
MSSVRLHTFALIGVVLAQLWNATLTFAAAIGATWVLPRVAGGQYTEMSAGLRSIYGAIAVFSLAVIAVAWHLYRHREPALRIVQFSGLLIAFYSVSAAINLASRSPVERWNALAAIVTVVGLLRLKRSKSGRE